MTKVVTGPPFTIGRYESFGQCLVAERDWLLLENERLRIEKGDLYQKIDRLIWLIQNGEHYYGTLWREATAKDIEAVRAAAEPDEALSKCYDAFGIGSAVRTPSTLLANIENARRRSDCLSRIEDEFFTTAGIDDEGDMAEECTLNWGAEPAEYVEQFRAALAARGAVKSSDSWETQCELCGNKSSFGRGRNLKCYCGGFCRDMPAVKADEQQEPK